MNVYLTHIDVYTYKCPMTQDDKIVDFACAAQTLRRAARLISRRYEDGLRQVNLTASQFSILQALSFAKRMPFAMISKTLGLEQTTLSRLLKTMEKRELIRIEADDNDGRGRIVIATNEGREIFEHAKQIWQPINDEHLSRITVEDWATVKAALNALTK